MEYLINLRQHIISLEDYSLKVTLLPKYAQSLVSNPRDDMSRFGTAVSNLFEEECRTVIFHE